MEYLKNNNKNSKKHLIISGRVQGVGFRAYVLRKAKELDIKGWVKNTYDGNVETVICGERLAVLEMIRLLKKGTRWASVEKIRVISTRVNDEFDRFKIKI